MNGLVAAALCSCMQCDHTLTIRVECSVHNPSALPAPPIVVPLE